MRRGLIYFVLFGLIFISRDSWCQSTDSLEIKKDSKQEVVLKEVVVQADKKKDIQGGIAFFPTKREKRFATDAVTMLELMALPELPFDPVKNTVTDASGAQVNFFIDGREANSQELKSLNPKDVDRVEFLTMPTDPKFMGKQNVVNFVMKRYLTGGYTKLTADQNLAGYQGDYSVASKVAYKELTYDIYLSGGYQTINKSGFKSENLYKDIMYNGNNYEYINEYIDKQGQHYKNNNLGAMLKVGWIHRSVNFSARGGWNWQEMPYKWGDATTIYEPDVVKSSRFYSENSSLNINPYLYLSLNLTLPKNQSLNISANGRYTAGRANSVYSPSGLTQIINENHNKRWVTYATAIYSKRFDASNSFNALAQFSQEWSDTEYVGSFQGLDKYREFGYYVTAGYSHTFSPGRLLTATMGIQGHNQKFSGSKRNSVYPNFELKFNNKWNRKSRFTFSTSLNTYGYFGNILNDVLLRQSELNWRQGNQNLKNRIWWQNTISNIWSFSNNFSLTGKLGHTIVFNQDNPVWSVLDGYDGVVQSTFDDATSHRLIVGLRTTLRLVNRKLVINGNFDYTYLNMTGRYRFDYSSFNGYLGVTWNGENWYVSAYLTPPTSMHEYLSIEKKYTNWYYYVKLGYNIKNLNISVTAKNPFGSRLSSIDWVETDHFCQKSNNYSKLSANVFKLQFTYSFSYGKKVSTSISAPSQMLKSGAMQAD